MSESFQTCMQLWLRSISTMFGWLKSSGMASGGNPGQHNHLNLLERCLQSPVNFTPLSLSNLSPCIFFNASALKLGSWDPCKSNVTPSILSVPCKKKQKEISKKTLNCKWKDYLYTWSKAINWMYELKERYRQHLLSTISCCGTSRSNKYTSSVLQTLYIG